MNEKELIELVAEILEIDVAGLIDTTNLEAMGWDSLTQLAFIADLDSKFEIRVDAFSLSGAETLSDLKLMLLNS